MPHMRMSHVTHTNDIRVTVLHTRAGTTTVGAIGPAFVSKIDEITGKLSLF